MHPHDINGGGEQVLIRDQWGTRQNANKQEH